MTCTQCDGVEQQFGASAAKKSLKRYRRRGPDATTRLAAACLAVMLVAMFPANVYAAQRGLSIGGRPVTELPLRTAVQIALVVASAAIAATDREGRVTFARQPDWAVRTDR